MNTPGSVPVLPLVPVLVLMLLAAALCAAQTASQRLERLAAESYERAFDLFPVNEIFSHETRAIDAQDRKRSL